MLDWLKASQRANRHIAQSSALNSGLGPSTKRLNSMPPLPSTETFRSLATVQDSPTTQNVRSRLQPSTPGCSQLSLRHKPKPGLYPNIFRARAHDSRLGNPSNCDPTWPVETVESLLVAAFNRSRESKDRPPASPRREEGGQQQSATAWFRTNKSRSHTAAGATTALSYNMRAEKHQVPQPIKLLKTSRRYDHQEDRMPKQQWIQSEKRSHHTEAHALPQAPQLGIPRASSMRPKLADTHGPHFTPGRGSPEHHPHQQQLQVQSQPHTQTQTQTQKEGQGQRGVGTTKLSELYGQASSLWLVQTVSKSPLVPSADVQQPRRVPLLRVSPMTLSCAVQSTLQSSPVSLEGNKISLPKVEKPLPRCFQSLTPRNLGSERLPEPHFKAATREEAGQSKGKVHVLAMSQLKPMLTNDDNDLNPWTTDDHDDLLSLDNMF